MCKTKLLTFALVSLLTASASAQSVTGTYLSNKPTLTLANVTATGPYIYTEVPGVAAKKVLFPDLLDYHGEGTTDVLTRGGAILNGNLSVTGTSVLTGTLTLSGGITVNSLQPNLPLINLRNTSTSGYSGIHAYDPANTFKFSTGYANANAALFAGAAYITTGASTDYVLATNSTERMRITSTGYVSMGVSTATNFLTLYNPTSNSEAIISLDGPAFSSGTRFRGVRFNNAGSEKGAIQYKYATGTETLELGAQGAVALGLYNNGAYRLWITTSGNMGISTTAAHSTFQTAGSVASSIRATTTNGNITSTDCVVTATGAITLTLPTAASITGREYVIKNIGGGSITAASAGGTIDGATTQTIVTGTGAMSSMKFKSDGTNWIITY